MATFVMLGKYSPQALQQMSADRTSKAVDKLKQFGGNVRSMWATLGSQDLVFIVDFPDNAAAVKASVALGKMTGIAFTTSPAVSVEEFDKLTAGL